jgi:hypothetical protein
MLTDAHAGSLPPNRFWGKVLSTLPVVMLGTAQAMCIQETTAFMDGTTLAVVGDNGSRRASLGTIKVHRMNGSDCYDLNLAKGAPRNCGNQNTPNLLVEQPSSCRLDFLEVSGDPAMAWIAGGRYVRQRMPAIPTHFYDDKYVHGIHCDEPLLPSPSATFEQCHGIVARVAALTDYARTPRPASPQARDCSEQSDARGRLVRPQSRLPAGQKPKAKETWQCWRPALPRSIEGNDDV